MGSGAEKKSRSSLETRLGRGNPLLSSHVTGTECLLCCSPALEDILLGSPNSANHSFQEFFLENHSNHVISKYEQSNWFSGYLAMLNQQAQDFWRSVQTHLLRRQGRVWLVYKFDEKCFKR